MRSKVAAAVFFLLALRVVSRADGNLIFYQLFWAFRLVVVGGCLLAREPARRQSGLFITALVIFSTFIPFAYSSHENFARPVALTLGLLGVMLMSSLFSLWGILTLGRSFGISPAVRTKVASGPYQYFRHPIYLGYSVSECALFALAPSVWNGGILLVSLAGYALRGGLETRLFETESAMRT